jgi:hypothetical protein
MYRPHAYSSIGGVIWKLLLPGMHRILSRPRRHGQGVGVGLSRGFLLWTCHGEPVHHARRDALFIHHVLMHSLGHETWRSHVLMVRHGRRRKGQSRRRCTVRRRPGIRRDRGPPLLASQSLVAGRGHELMPRQRRRLKREARRIRRTHQRSGSRRGRAHRPHCSPHRSKPHLSLQRRRLLRRRRASGGTGRRVGSPTGASVGSAIRAEAGTRPPPPRRRRDRTFRRPGSIKLVERREAVGGGGGRRSGARLRLLPGRRVGPGVGCAGRTVLRLHDQLARRRARRWRRRVEHGRLWGRLGWVGSGAGGSRGACELVSLGIGGYRWISVLRGRRMKATAIWMAW